MTRNNKAKPLRRGKWVDKLEGAGRRWTRIYRGSHKRALYAAINAYAARRRRGLKVEIRKRGGTVEIRRTS